MKLRKAECHGVAWIKNCFRVIHKEPRIITRGRNRGKFEVVVRLFTGDNGFRKRIVDRSAIRSEVFA